MFSERYAPVSVPSATVLVRCVEPSGLDAESAARPRRPMRSIRRSRVTSPLYSLERPRRPMGSALARASRCPSTSLGARDPLKLKVVRALTYRWPLTFTGSPVVSGYLRLIFSFLLFQVVSPGSDALLSRLRGLIPRGEYSAGPSGGLSGRTRRPLSPRRPARVEKFRASYLARRLRVLPVLRRSLRFFRL